MTDAPLFNACLLTETGEGNSWELGGEPKRHDAEVVRWRRRRGICDSGLYRCTVTGRMRDWIDSLAGGVLEEGVEALAVLEQPEPLQMLEKRSS